MAKVLNQGVSPVGPIIKQFIPDKLDELTGKKLGDVPSYFLNFLDKSNFNLENDEYGNPYIVDKNDARISIAIAIVNENKVCIYTRDGSEPNINDGVDVIGSIGYALPSLVHKVSDEMLELVIKKATLAKQYTWETTDCQGDKELVKMPIILLEMEENPLCSIPVADIHNPTAKMQAVINELS